MLQGYLLDVVEGSSLLTSYGVIAGAHSGKGFGPGPVGRVVR